MIYYGTDEVLLDFIKKGFERFHSEHGRYPNAYEINHCEYLPGTKTIDRRFGGMRALRSILGHATIDMREGNIRSIKCVDINKRGFIVEQYIYDILCKKFDKQSIHKEFPPADDKRTRVDFYVHTKSGNFFVDVFYPNDPESMSRSEEHTSELQSQR